MDGASTAPAHLGKYEVRGTLGRGAMGTVYDGWDPIIGRRVAIKTVPLLDQADPDAREGLARFKREAQAAGRLSHPNIVGVYDYGETMEAAFIVMEFVDGKSLKERLDAGERFAPSETVTILEQILAGLQFSHNAGVIHRDVKPGNVMMTRDGRVKLADFGIARIESSTMTQDGSILGTPAYMSPEQLTAQSVDARSDLYAAGVLLYQLLAGERPFNGGIAAITHKALNTVPPRPSDISVGAPPELDPVVARAMARRPADRFASADAFARALTTAFHPAGASAADDRRPADDATAILTPPRDGSHATTRGTDQGTAQGTAARAALSATPKAVVQRRSMAPLIGGAAAILLVAAGGAWFALRPAPQDRPPAQVADATPSTGTTSGGKTPGGTTTTSREPPSTQAGPQETAPAAGSTTSKSAASTTGASAPDTKSKQPSSTSTPSSGSSQTPPTTTTEVEPPTAKSTQPVEASHPTTTQDPASTGAGTVTSGVTGAGPAGRDVPSSGAPSSGAPASGAPASGAPGSGTPGSGTPGTGSPAAGAAAAGGTSASEAAQSGTRSTQSGTAPTQSAALDTRMPPRLDDTENQHPVALAAPLTPALLREALLAVRRSASCALPRFGVSDEGRVDVWGLVGSGAPEAALRARAQTAAPGAPLTWHPTVVDGPYCAALDAIRPIAQPSSPFFGLGFKDDATRLKDHDAIAPILRLPDFAPHLLVDYLSHDGTVTHLFPNAANPDHVFTANTTLLLRDLLKASWEVGPPFGTDMMIAVASAGPLFATRRPADGETAATYLPALQDAIEAARRKNTKVTGQAIALETLAR